MRIAEIYKSIQGEGFLTGTESVFVRASGCNLRCRFCDTPYASWRPEGDDLSVDDILARTLDWNCPHVVLTGGEPMLFSELSPLCERLHKRGRHITIETAGTLYLPVACDLMSISPKTSNSTPTIDEAPDWVARHERTRRAPEVLERLIADYECQLKFVVDQPSDCDEILAMLERLDLQRDRVMLMPQGVEESELDRTGEWLRPFCDQQGLVFCPRKQIEWFGLERAT